MISMHLDGDFETSKWLKNFKIQHFRNILNEAGKMGVAALSEEKLRLLGNIPYQRPRLE